MSDRRFAAAHLTCAGFVLAVVFACGPISQASRPVESRGQLDGQRSEQRLVPDSAALASLVDSIVRREMGVQHIPGAAFVFVANGRMVYKKGFGVANVDRNTLVDPDSTLFRIGSISKLMTATALVQLADRDRVLLAVDVNRYLRSATVPQTFPAPVTAAHLLSHTAGFDEIRPGTQAADESGVQSLGEFLRTRLVRVRLPGEVPAYSTYGITLAGLLIEDVTGMPFEEYLRANIWRPLGMTRTAITLTSDLRARLAPGYEFANGRHVEQPYEWYHTTPASSINATAADMGRFLLAHLEDGASGSTRMLSADATRLMRQSHARGHPDVPGVGYGFFEGDYAGVRIVEHLGSVAGVSSALVLFPDQRSGFFLANHGESSTLRDSVKLAIVQRFYSKPNVPPRAIALSSEEARRFTGTYRWNVYCHTCGRPVPTMGPRVTYNDDGTLSFAGRRWARTGPLRFHRIDGAQTIGFREDGAGRIAHLFIDGALTFEHVF